jgi:hypothetical protein
MVGADALSSLVAVVSAADSGAAEAFARGSAIDGSCSARWIAKTKAPNDHDVSGTAPPSRMTRVQRSRIAPNISSMAALICLAIVPCRASAAGLIAFVDALAAAAEAGLKGHERWAASRALLARKLAGRRTTSRLPALVDYVMRSPMRRFESLDIAYIIVFSGGLFSGEFAGFTGFVFKASRGRDGFTRNFGRGHYENLSGAISWLTFSAG